MLGFTKIVDGKTTSELSDIYRAIGRSMAVIEFKPDGTILHANQNFLATVGYDLNEIKGKHHRMFADPEYAQSNEYNEFWASLARGEFRADEFKRYGKGGKEIWIEASYNPIFGQNGKVYKVIKFATDITEKKKQAALSNGMVEAINRSQAVIHFELDGTIKDANENFLATVGYTLDEIKGQHHSIFAEPDFAASQAYKEFWEKLGRGEFQAGQYKRLGKGGKEIWIEASYNPIFDADGKPFMVTKFATDLTTRKNENKLLADDFETNVQSLVQVVASSSSQMESTVQSMAAAAEETSSQSSVVASATEELSASVNEISNHVATSTQIVEDAVGETRKSEKLVSELVAAATKIGEVTAIISDIAEQTNLLALNATIEAARAGEAGKGFAVVASEVKNLAQQTAKATDEITTQVHDIQNASNTTADAINNISDVIGKVSEISIMISGAVEQQSAATSEVSQNIISVQSAASESGESSTVMLEVAKDMSERSEELNDRVASFLNNVRAM